MQDRSVALDDTHDPARRSWVASANGHPDFPVQNLPFGVFSPPGAPARRAGVLAMPSSICRGFSRGPVHREAAHAAALGDQRPANAFMAPHRARHAFAPGVELLTEGQPSSPRWQCCTGDAMHAAPSAASATTVSKRASQCGVSRGVAGPATSHTNTFDGYTAARRRLPVGTPCVARRSVAGFGGREAPSSAPPSARLRSELAILDAAGTRGARPSHRRSLRPRADSAATTGPSVTCRRGSTSRWVRSWPRASPRASAPGS